MNPHFDLLRAARLFVLLLATLGVGGASLAADPGRLFYTPAQRAQLDAARASKVTQAGQATPDVAPPQRFDGMVIRSDGHRTSWVNGQPHAGATGAAGLKPGQIRAGGRIYEPYQVLRPAPSPAITEGATP